MKLFFLANISHEFRYNTTTQVAPSHFDRLTYFSNMLEVAETGGKHVMVRGTDLDNGFQVAIQVRDTDQLKSLNEFCAQAQVHQSNVDVTGRKKSKSCSTWKICSTKQINNLHVS